MYLLNPAVVFSRDLLDASLVLKDEASLTDAIPVVVEDDAISLLQVHSHKTNHLAASQKLKVGNPEVNRQTKGNEVKERSMVDADVTNAEFVDHGAANFAWNGYLTSARFYVQQAGNFGFRFRIYRPSRPWKLIGQTEVIDMPQAGVIQEVTFSEPVRYRQGDYIGWSHDGRGSMPFDLDKAHPPNWVNPTVNWNTNKNDNVGVDRPMSQNQGRRYSYEVTTSRQLMIAREKIDDNTNFEVCDTGAGNFGSSGWLTSARFYVQRAGSFGFRFRIYRPSARGWTLKGQTEALDMPQEGVVQEVTFSEPVEFRTGDYIGWSHEGKGNIPYEVPEEILHPLPEVYWSLDKNDELGKHDILLPNKQYRTYSYEVFTSPERPVITTTTTTEAPEVGEAAAVGDPHLERLAGEDKDLKTSDLQR